MTDTEAGDRALHEASACSAGSLILKAASDVIGAAATSDLVAKRAYLKLTRYSLQDALRIIDMDVRDLTRRIGDGPKPEGTVYLSYAADDETAPPPALADAAE